MMRPKGKFYAGWMILIAAAALPAVSAHAQSYPISCDIFHQAQQRLQQKYRPYAVPIASPDLAQDVVTEPANAAQLDPALLDTALSSYNRHHCLNGKARGFGPSSMVVVDFAKPSSQPRLYAIDLLSGRGLDTPVLVAHGVGSDPDDDGIADRFSNIQNSLASSLGAARGAELYHGSNGLSLRLDGLDVSNNAMRVRDIVAHSYQPERRRYFNASLLSARAGKPGTSEGCFVVAPHLRDWLYGLLRDGGFLYAGLGGNRAREMPGLPVYSSVIN